MLFDALLLFDAVSINVLPDAAFLVHVGVQHDNIQQQ